MRSNQATSDAFDNRINAAKDSVSAFYRSLATGDWAPFKDGVASTLTELYELSAVMDDLADKKLSLGFIKTQDMAAITEMEAKTKDLTLSFEERKKAAEEMKAKIESLSTNTIDYIEDLQGALAKSYKANYGIELDTSDLEHFFRYTNFGNKEALKGVEEYRKGLRALENQHTKTSVSRSTGATRTYVTTAGQREIEAYKEQNRFLRVQSTLLNENDENRKATLDLLSEQFDLQRSINELQKRALMVANRIKPKKGGGEDYEAGSLGDIEAEIASLRKVWRTSSDEGIREGALAAIKDLEAKKRKIEFVPGSLADVKAEITSLQKVWENSTDEAVKAGALAAIKDLEKQKKWIQLEATLRINNLAGKASKGFDLPDIGEKLKNVKIGRIEPVEFVNNDKLATSIELMQTLSTLTNNFGGVTENATAGWFSYASNVITAISTMIPVVATLFGLEAALGVAEQSKKPFPMNVLAMAGTVVGLAAALMAIPKFATGGIVGGSSYSGDKVLAGLNSGEMVLNAGQQGNLFKMINSGGQPGAAGVGEVTTVKLKGSDLYAAISNYKTKNSKF
ncbi:MULTISPECIES: hypothetical protein [unclassified Parabacteroides]|uniref:hypothetical protein n=1 Tax=unclassified Parabacteroides TaxID=2649774 RepID=UPI002473CA02|nr:MULTISPECIES: hypothetical protein [unclassified Parabacteroides]